MSGPGFRRILAATDGSDAADAALDVAGSLALESDHAEVRVVHVWRLDLHHRHRVWDVELRRNAEGLLDSAAGRLRALGVTADRELEWSDRTHVAPAIVEAARRFLADVVVVGSRGMSDWQALIHHSAGHGLMGSLDCPLLMVRARPGFPVDAPMRVLVAVGSRDEVGPAVQAASAAAARTGSIVLVAHASLGFAGPAEPGRQTVDHAINMLRESGVEADGWVLKAGDAAGVIADAATRWAADVVVMGPVRFGALSSLMFELATDELLRETDLPVLTAATTRS